MPEGVADLEGIVNDFYTKHRYSVIMLMYMNETTAGATAKSSNSIWLGLPGSGPK